MKVYSYDYSGKFICEAKAEECQIEKGKFILPAFSTERAPKVVKGKDAFFIDGEWVYKETPKAEVHEEEKPREMTEDEKFIEYRVRNYPNVFEYIDALIDDDKPAQVAYLKKCKDIRDKFIP